MSRLYLDGDEELILTLYRGPTLRETIRNIRQVLNMSTTDEEMTDGITTCWFLEDAETVTRLPFFFREKDHAVAPRTGGQSVTLPGKEGSWTAEDTRIVHGRIIYLMAQSREDKTVRCVVDADGNAPGYDAAGGFTGEIMEKLKKWTGNMKRFQGDIGVFARSP